MLERAAVGQLPEPYWLSYKLETDRRAVTSHLAVTATLADAVRRLDLRRDEVGWSVNGEARPELAEALDCDLASSPITNTMPIIRHGIHRNAVEHEFVVAFVAVPALRVQVVRQTYRHLELVSGGACVRYSAGEFSSDLLVDEHGLVVDYPTMAHRVPAQTEISTSERVGGPGSARSGSA